MISKIKFYSWSFIVKLPVHVALKLSEPTASKMDTRLPDIVLPYFVYGNTRKLAGESFQIRLLLPDFNTELLGFNPKPSDVNPELSGFNPHPSGFNPELLGFNPDPPGFNPETIY